MTHFKELMVIVNAYYFYLLMIIFFMGAFLNVSSKEYQFQCIRNNEDEKKETNMTPRQQIRMKSWELFLWMTSWMPEKWIARLNRFNVDEAELMAQDESEMLQAQKLMENKANRGLLGRKSRT